MKPTPQILQRRTHIGGELLPHRSRTNAPRTDYNFQPLAGETRGSRKLSRPVFAPGFRDLSKEFLGKETKRSYIAEVIFFGIIVAVSAWPIASMVRALAQLTK